MFPYIQSEGGFFYDYPELAFFALAAWAALKFDWWTIIPLAALGAWNKETFLLFIPALYPFIRQRSSRLGAWFGIAVLSLVSIAVYLPIHSQFAHNPGGALEMHWRDQLNYFLDLRNLLFGLEKTYGVYTLRALSLGPMALLTWTVLRGWRRLPLLARQHAQIAAAINIPLYFVFCWPGELRNLSMLYVTFLLLLAVNLKDWVRSSAPVDASPSD